MRFFFLLTLFFLYVSVADAQFEKEPAWRDEFDSNGTPNKAIWSRSTKGETGQLSCYCNDDRNAYVKDGKLHLRLYASGDTLKPYKSGRVVTNKKYAIQTGKLVVRAKVPVFPGIWPALWLTRTGKDSLSFHTELDLMEYTYSMGKVMHPNFHLWGNFDGKEHNHKQYPANFKTDVSKWHKYTLEIHEDKIIMRVDGKISYSIKKGEKSEYWPDNQKYQFRIALAYGGWAAKKCGTDDSKLPAEMLVDYVRFYNLKK